MAFVLFPVRVLLFCLKHSQKEHSLLFGFEAMKNEKIGCCLCHFVTANATKSKNEQEKENNFQKGKQKKDSFVLLRIDSCCCHMNFLCLLFHQKAMNAKQLLLFCIPVLYLLCLKIHFRLQLRLKSPNGTSSVECVAVAVAVAVEIDEDVVRLTGGQQQVTLQMAAVSLLSCLLVLILF